MRYGKMMAVTVLGAFAVASPFAAQAQTTKDKVENKMEQAKDTAKSTTQDTTCVIATSPAPRILPARSVSGDTLDTTTSATRVVFSSSTLRRICCP